MSLTALAAYGGGAPPAGVTTQEYTIALDGETSAGVVAYPTALAAAGQGILHVRGGTTLGAVSLADTDVDVLEDLVSYAATAFGDPTGGRTIFAPAIRGCSATVWPGGPASGGTDEFGGDDLNDLALSWGVMDEIGVAAGTPAIHSGKKGAMGFSSGAMRLLMALRANMFLPRAVCLRAPLTNISYAGHVVSDEVRAMIPDWTSPSGTIHENLTEYERGEKLKRSPLHWCGDLPFIKYGVLDAELDSTIRKADTDAFIQNMVNAGHHIERMRVPTAGHSFGSSDLVKAANTQIRGFFNRHLN